MPLTLEQITEYLQKASEQAGQATKSVSDKKFGERVVDEIYAQTDAIQNMINNLLSKGGVITQEELDQVDEQLRIQKEKLLAYESKKTTSRIITYSILAFATIGFLWFVTKQKN